MTVTTSGTDRRRRSPRGIIVAPPPSPPVANRRPNGVVAGRYSARQGLTVRLLFAVTRGESGHGRRTAVLRGSRTVDGRTARPIGPAAPLGGAARAARGA